MPVEVPQPKKRFQNNLIKIFTKSVPKTIIRKKRIQEVVISMIKATSESYKSRLYNKAISDLVYGQCLSKTI